MTARKLMEILLQLDLDKDVVFELPNTKEQVLFNIHGAIDFNDKTILIHS